MKVVVTGGMGYIGSNIVRSLVAMGHQVLVLDVASGKFMKDFGFIKADITKFDDLESLSIKNCDAVLHLAAQSSGPRSFDVPEKDLTINVIGTVNLIRWAMQNNIPRFLFASSFVVYGDHAEVEMMSEDLLCRPKSIYALSKFSCEHLLNIYGLQYGLKWNALRMFNVYGPGQDLSRTDQGIVSIFMNYVLRGDYVPVQGRLDRFRDLIFIEDVVQGWERCLANPEHSNKVYNLGSGVKTQISTLIQTIIDSLGKTGRVKVEQVGSTPGDIIGAYADISRITRDLGYRPKYELHVGVSKMAEWALENAVPTE